MFLKPLPSTKAKEKKSVFEIGESEVFPSFRLNYDFLECFKKPLSLATTRKRRSDAEKMAEASQEKIASTSLNADEVPASVDSVVRYTEEELTAFKENMASENTKKSTGTSVRRLQSWYMEKYQTELNLNSISKTEAPRLLKHFFVEIRQTTNENKGKEYEPGTLQTYRNGLRRYFLERVCPPAPDNFDIDNFEDIATMLSVKKKDLKKKGFGNKPNAAQPMECPYVGHRPNGEKVPRNFFLTPVENPTSNVWYKMVPVGRNKLAKQMQEIASFASLDGNSQIQVAVKQSSKAYETSFTRWKSRSSQVTQTPVPLPVTATIPWKNNEECQTSWLVFHLLLPQLPTPTGDLRHKFYGKLLSTVLPCEQQSRTTQQP